MSSTVNFYAMKAIQSFRGKVLKRKGLREIIKLSVSASREDLSNAVSFLVRKKLVTKIGEDQYFIN